MFYRFINCRPGFLVFCAFAGAWFSTPAAAQMPASASSAIHGIYAWNAVHDYPLQGGWSIDPAILTDASVGGVVLRFSWQDIEPSEGTFDWSTVDKLVAQAGSYGKFVSLTVMPGVRSPAWVYRAGAQSFTFVWSLGWGFPLCSVQRLPVPWDPVFLSNWNALVQALGARYNSNSTIASVKLTGVNSATSETFLPTSQNAIISNNSVSCTSYNDVADWESVGYRPSKVQDAWTQIAETFATSFPDKMLEAILVPGGFPPIDSNGNVYSPPDSQDPTLSANLVEAGIGLLGGQFVIQNDGLTSNWVWTIEANYSQEVATGYQTVGVMGNLLPATLINGLDAGAKYVEVYEPDLVTESLQRSIENAADALQ
jgi:hypothetical protein